MEGTWLKDHQTLRHYSVAAGDVLRCRLPIRPFRIRILDEIKTIEMNEMLTVQEAVEKIADSRDGVDVDLTTADIGPC